MRIPGLSLAIIQNGRVIKQRGYGFANLELKTPAGKETVYEIGSTTKQFTAPICYRLSIGEETDASSIPHLVPGSFFYPIRYPFILPRSRW